MGIRGLLKTLVGVDGLMRYVSCGHLSHNKCDEMLDI
jgi:hypothetical protein